MPSHKNARSGATLGVSPHPHSGALPDLPRTRGCPRVSPVAIDRRSCGTRNRRLTAHERMYHLAESQMILCNPSRLWRAGYKPRRMAGCSRRDDSHGWNPWDTTHAYLPRNAPVWGCGLTPRVAALMTSLAPIIAYQPRLSPNFIVARQPNSHISDFTRPLPATMRVCAPLPERYGTAMILNLEFV